MSNHLKLCSSRINDEHVGSQRTRNGHSATFSRAVFRLGQNIKNQGVFAAARLDVGPFFFYLIFIFSLLF